MPNGTKMTHLGQKIDPQGLLNWSKIFQFRIIFKFKIIYKFQIPRQLRESVAKVRCKANLGQHARRLQPGLGADAIARCPHRQQDELLQSLCNLPPGRSRRRAARAWAICSHSVAIMAHRLPRVAVEDLRDGGDLGDAVLMLLDALREANTKRSAASVAEPWIGSVQ